MNKSDDKLNILRDIRVYDYVANDQESASREQFEKALNDDSELQSDCLLYTSPSPRDKRQSRMPSSA